MKTHTPGPWSAYVGDHGFEVYQDDGHGNGDGIQGIKGHPEALANARLIASAPDLLAALTFVQKYHAMMAEKGTPMPSQLVDSVNNAISKATAI
jgi:hypothetical protein